MAESGGSLLTTQEVARLLRVHPKQVYRLLKRGLPALRVGDEWRFERERVLVWSSLGRPDGHGAASDAAPAENAPPSLLAANGDCAVEALLDALRLAPGPLLGLVQADHTEAAALLVRGRVLLAGQHGAAGTKSSLPKCARLHLVTREVGLAMPARVKLKGVSGIVGKRLASRPGTAGIRRELDRALAGAGVEAASAYRNATEYASHRDVVLAVAAGKADVALTTLAWARAANLRFVALGREAYELAIPVHLLGDPRVVGVCEAAQSLRLRKRLRDVFGYDVKQTGALRIGGQ